ncbi:hypothetical protein ABFS82_04G214900 [Erythranthe guttata]
MRRQGARYGGDSGGGGSGGGGGHHAYGGGGGGGGGQMHQHHQNNKSGYYQGRHQEEQPLREKEGGGQQDNDWRWERDAAQTKLPQTAMSPTAPFSEGQGREAPRSYYQNQRMDLRMPSERQGGVDPRSQSHEDDMDLGYEDNRSVQTFENLEQRFLDDIMKLSKEQTDAEDAENVRHRERINTISTQYEEQLYALRARHASRRDEFLRRESQARHEQYQQIIVENDPRSFNANNAPDSYGTHRDRARFSGNGGGDHHQGYEGKVPYPRGRSYDTGSRYY